MKKEIYDKAKTTIKNLLGFLPDIEDFEYIELTDTYEDAELVCVTDEDGYLVDEYYKYVDKEYTVACELRYEDEEYIATNDKEEITLEIIDDFSSLRAYLTTKRTKTESKEIKIY